MNQLFIATSSFAQYSTKPLNLLESQGYNVSLNDQGRKLTEDEIIVRAHNCIGVIAGTESYSEKVLNKLHKLKVVSRLGVGLDNIEMDIAQRNNIEVYHTETNPAPAVAELVLGLFIDVSRSISQTNKYLKAGEWKKQIGNLLYGKTLGIIGLGTIGKTLVRVAKGFHFKILAFDNQKDATFAKNEDVTYCDLEMLLENSDLISIHLNLSDETKRLIDQEKLYLMKTDAILINTSRGEIIDEKALYEVLKSKKLGGAGLDVFEQEPYSGPLTELDNVVLTPHIGAYAREIRVKMEIEAAENLIRGLNEV